MSGYWIVAFVVLSVAVAALGVVVAGVLRQVTVVLERAESQVNAVRSGQAIRGATPGTVLPVFGLMDPAGQWISSEVLAAKSALFLFAESGCAPCDDILRELDGAREVDGVPIYVIASHEDDRFSAPVNAQVLYQHGKTITALFQSGATPQAFLVAGGVVVANYVPNTLTDLRALVRQHVKGGDAILDMEDVAVHSS